MADKERPELSLDKGAEQGFCSFFKSLPQKPDTTIRIFERNGGDFYSVHAEDALYVAQNIYQTSAVIKYLGGEGARAVPSCTLSKLNAVAFLRDLLLSKLYRVEIWEIEGRSNWKIGKRASPGNLQAVEDLIFRDNDVSTSPVVLAVKLGTKNEQIYVGAAYADTTTQRKLGVTEFVDNDTLSNFESLLIQLSVKECVVSDEAGNYELKKLKAILERCDVVITECKKGDFNTKDIEQDVNRLLGEGVSVSTMPEFDLKLAMSCTAALIKYLGLMGDDTFHGQYIMEHHDLSRYMRLDAAAVKALNLMPSPQDGTRKNMSLYGLLNKCKTSQGSRLLSQWLKQPLMSLPDIVARQNLVEVFYQDTELRQSMQEDHLKNFPDLHRLAKKLQRGNSSSALQDVVRVYQVVIRLPGVKEALEVYDGKYKELFQEEFIQKLEHFIENLAPLQEMVETTIDLKAVEMHEFRIKPDYDPELQETRQKMEEVREQLQPEAERVAECLGLELDKKLKFERNSVHGYHLRLTRNDAGKIRDRKEYIELATQKAGVLFTTSTLRKLSQSFHELQGRYGTLQSNFVKDVVACVATYCGVLEALNQVVAQLDVLVSFAYVSIHAPTPYNRPTLSVKGQGNVILTKSRHPCLEMQDDVSFIANDVSLKRGESEFQIITGPNMGGKSTYIRQIGVVSLLAQCGCFVPCDEAELCIFDSVLARVGAGDSQLKGVSTFMAEMLETASILRSASLHSLIIIDELGRGTSTYDGFGLAWAISEHIATKIQAFTLFATHFHELTALSEQVPTVANLHVEAMADDKSITLMYKVKPGICDQSFGIHVAELAAFPEKVINLAKRKAAELEDFDTESAELRPPKYSKQEVDDGSKIVENFLRDFSRDASMANGEEEEMLKVVERLREKYQTEIHGNIYIRDMLVEL
ncbi:hypothetical protein SeMB42_g05681 [Synchytrium endobioticum]|uniref:DNA mismatch repair proteins mutS family domain-containing protein n=1 Tax=Synchytrium endobioticum TaxID=286115 RepID=A0A507CPX3_9FUNG|nr:hypothetical protein SeMB42_g05681 [Synchytrium endobioticum]